MESRFVTDRLLLLVPLTAYLVVFYLIPIATFLAQSVLGSDGLTIGPFQALFNRPAVANTLATSIRVATITTVIAVLLSYPTAYYLTTLSGRWLAFALALVSVPLLTSILVRTYAWIAILGRAGLINSTLGDAQIIGAPLALVFNEIGVVVGLVHVLVPFAILPMYSVMRGIDPSLLRAAESLGAGPRNAFLRIYLPLTLPGVSAGAVLVFIQAIGAYVTPAILGGARDRMIANLVAEEVQRTLNWPLAAALSVVMLTLTLATVGTYLWLSGRRRATTR